MRLTCEGYPKMKLVEGEDRKVTAHIFYFENKVCAVDTIIKRIGANKL